MEEGAKHNERGVYMDAAEEGRVQHGNLVWVGQEGSSTCRPSVATRSSVEPSAASQVIPPCVLIVGTVTGPLRFDTRLTPASAKML